MHFFDLLVANLCGLCLLPRINPAGFVRVRVNMDIALHYAKGHSSQSDLF